MTQQPAANVDDRRAASAANRLLGAIALTVHEAVRAGLDVPAAVMGALVTIDRWARTLRGEGTDPKEGI